MIKRQYPIPYWLTRAFKLLQNNQLNFLIKLLELNASAERKIKMLKRNENIENGTTSIGPSIQGQETTIPIKKVKIKSIKGISTHALFAALDPQKLDLRAPIILDLGNKVIGGALKFIEAANSGQEEIDAVYLDDLCELDITLEHLEKQFSDKEICLSFAYNLLSCVHNSIRALPYKAFCKNAQEIFDNSKLHAHVIHCVFEDIRRRRGRSIKDYEED